VLELTFQGEINRNFTYFVPLTWQNCVQLLVSEWSISFLEILLPSKIECRYRLLIYDLRWQSRLSWHVWQSWLVLEIVALLGESRMGLASWGFASCSRRRLWPFVLHWCNTVLVCKSWRSCCDSTTTRSCSSSNSRVTDCWRLIPFLTSWCISHLGCSSSRSIPLSRGSQTFSHSLSFLLGLVQIGLRLLLVPLWGRISSTSVNWFPFEMTFDYDIRLSLLFFLVNFSTFQNWWLTKLSTLELTTFSFSFSLYFLIVSNSSLHNLSVWSLLKCNIVWLLFLRVNSLQILTSLVLESIYSFWRK
jgi:hypothetical protein